MTTVYACKGFQKVPVKMAPSAPLQEVVLASYQKLGFSDWNRLELLHNDKKLDPSLQMRHSGLLQGSKLTVKETQKPLNASHGSSTAAGRQLKVALQMPGFPRVVDQISSQDTLFHLLDRHSFLSNIDHVLINGRAYGANEFSQPLSFFGLHEGSVLIRLIPKSNKPAVDTKNHDTMLTTSPSPKVDTKPSVSPENTDSPQSLEHVQDIPDVADSAPDIPLDTETYEAKPSNVVSSPNYEPSNLGNEETVPETQMEASAPATDIQSSSLQMPSQTADVKKSKQFNNKNILGSMMSKLKTGKQKEKEQNGYDLEPSKSQLELYQSILRKRASQPSRTISSNIPKSPPSTATVKFDFGDGKPLFHEFSKEEKIHDLHDFVASHLPNGFPSSFSLTFSNYEPLPTSGRVVEYIGRAIVRVHPK
ncbi:UB Xdomain protein Ubx4 [Schizosaccharomyces cryophilus OY26]|uniref:UB Xdomain protein Ubx4 n=1 Tax=Schizosaccharomyces cryophilus (strain OY26 / ATCC MYA-4695 / CBS 11777 / NBRC 106824 / NRRL Y48691) TaxID=653667 RepID=S9W532_SCHCR|nr:UB Xdomain protein Ubx4 [Schizosaccharomyces cryophilus OY26]EPY53649.1 UB Xdomain protein Ubx4 [Schizosaccharomyces cryophilus OY26]